MAKTLSNEFPLGTIAPNFTLVNTVNDKPFNLFSNKGKKGTVIMFICNHCPYVLHVNNELVKLAKDYQEKGFSFVAISSNDIVNYPQDAPHKMKEVAIQLSYPFPYLFDETQEVAKAYNAACTPDFFVFDATLKCVYNGQMDDSRPSNDISVTGVDLRKVLDAIEEDKPISLSFKPSLGCGIKWK